jgi:endonuclease/exonuclease/phosphatase family metal-dependent hydrolase
MIHSAQMTKPISHQQPVYPGVSRNFILILFSMLAVAVAPLSAESIKVVAWNIEWFPGLTPEATPAESERHMKQIRRELKRISPDVFIGTEIRDWQAFADAVEAVPGLQPAVVSSFRSLHSPGLWPQQIAIGSRLPVVAAWAERWREQFATNPRGFSVAALRVPGDSDDVILVYGVHLKSNRANNEDQTLINYLMREDSIVQILVHVAEMERFAFRDRVRGVIVGGDFNTNHDGQFADKVVEMMVQAGFHNTFAGVPREDRLTWRGSDRFEPTTFDYIFTKGLGKPQAKMIPVEEGSSDHWPVGVEITLAP